MKCRIRDLLPAALFSLQAEKEDIDFVFKDSFFLYVYKNDWIYSTIKESDRSFDIVRYNRRLNRLRQNAAVGGEITSVERVLLNIANNGTRPRYFDIGTNYGQWVVRAKRVLGPSFARLSVACFEPGLASRLAVINLALNDLYDVDFFVAAISNVDAIVPFFAASGHTEDNKLVNRIDKHITFPAWSITIESLLAKVETNAEIFLKIDTQGGEYEVFSGMGNCWDRPIAAVMEFCPKALSTRIKPLDFLVSIARVATIAELGPYQNFVKFVTALDFEELITRIWNRKLPFCDLFLLSQTHPRLRELESQLSGVCAH